MDELPFGGVPARPGTVSLVGGGPGDPGLLSLRAARLLSTATVVAYDRLAPAAGLALCSPECELVDVGKQPDRHKLSQDEINALLVDRARNGQAVVRFKGGDPFVLGRGSEEAIACAQADVPFEVVPGMTAGLAATAYAGIPVTHRGVAPAFAVVTGHEDPTKPDTQVDYPALAAFPGTLVVYMGVGRAAAIADALIEAGKPPHTPAAAVSWGTTSRQRTVTGLLGDIADRVRAAALGNPAVIVIGDVVGVRRQIGGWFEQRPLHRTSVLVPRTRHQASALSERLRELGAEPVEAPTIAIGPTEEPELLRKALAQRWDWIAFTSANAVDAVWEQILALGGDARALAGSRLAAVGPGTAAALAGRGLHADVLPERFTTRGLADALAAAGPARILLPRADIATPVLADALRRAGWDVTEVEAYRTVRPDGLPEGVAERLRQGDVDIVAFASSSTVRNLVDLLGGPPHPDARVVSIGPVTSDTCRELGLRVDAEANPHDLGGLVDAVVEVSHRA